MKTLFPSIGLFIFFASLLFISINIDDPAFGQEEPSQHPVEMEGYFNILEIIYANGGHDEKYYLFVDDEFSNIPIPYQIEFTNPGEFLTAFSGKHVVIKGNTVDSQDRSSSPFGEVQILANSIELDYSAITSPSNSPNTQSHNLSGQGIPSPLKSYVILTKFADLPAFEPHDTSYYNDLLYNNTIGEYSLRNYWLDASFGALDITPAGITDWVTVAKNSTEYNNTNASIINDYAFSAIVLAEAVASIDFNGDDDVIQNSSAANLQSSGPNGDDIDQIFFVYNELSFNCQCAFAYFSPVQTVTAQGNIWLYLLFLPDQNAFGGFALGPGYLGGIGVAAHETGHNFNWNHTPTPPPFNPLNGPYADPWSVMGKVADFSNLDPAGPIAFQKDHAGWIPAGDIMTVADGEEATFTLDFLSDPSPGPNYLMAEIPFGGGGDYYTLELRKDTLFDNTPEDKLGLLIYHISPTGHPLSGEPPNGPVVPNASIVDVNGAVTPADWKDANLALSDSFTANGVTITHDSQTADTATVTVSNNVAPSPDCSPPGEGDWVVTSSCEMTANATASGNVIIQNDSVLTIPDGITLTIPTGFGLSIISGSGVLIQLGGTIIIIS